MKNLSFFTCLAAMLFIFSCGPSGPCNHENCCATIDQDQAKAAITGLEAAYTTASNSKDVDALMAYYADDAQSMAPDEPTLVGKEAIRARTIEEMAEDTSAGISATMAVTDVWAAGNIAVETGTWTAANPDGEVVNAGKYISLFEKRDGKYVCIRDIWNSDTDEDDDDDDDDDEDEDEDEDDDEEDS